jgi:tetratricopeptide (TPR) repeat protein
MLASSVGEWQIAAQWLKQIPQLALSADVVYAQGLFALAQGDPNAALAAWQPATDEAWLARIRFQHPERWQQNTAAQAYYLLRGDLAMERRAWRDAQAFYTQAIQTGTNTVGTYFLASAYRADGQLEQAARQSATLPASLPPLKPLLTVAQSGSAYLTASEVVHGANEQTLNISAFVASLRNLPVSPDTLTVKIIQPDSNVQYGSTQIRLTEGLEADPLVATLRQVSVPVMLDTLPAPLTAAVAIIEATSQTEIVLARQTVPIVLARPDSVSIPSTATLTNFRFGTDITLQAYRAQANARSLTLDLYWQASTTPIQDYQIFVHVLDATGKLIAQLDSAPVDGRYPTRQWRTETTIEEQREFTFATPLEAGTYTVEVGMYSLADLKRLPVTVDSAVGQADTKAEDTAMLLRFTP